MKLLKFYICLALLTTGIGASGSTTDSISESGLVAYIPPNPESPLRRREAGVADSESSVAVRGAARGAARGSARGAARGAARGIVRGVTRGIVRGVARGAARGSSRGIVRGASRGVLRGTARANARGASRSTGRGVARANARAASRSTGRGEARGSALGVEEDIPVAELLPPPKRIEPLAPQPTGYTAHAQPVLYFYLSDPSSDPIQFSLTRNDKIDPVLDIELPFDQEKGQVEAGIHSIALADYDIVLEPGAEYEWFVFIVLDWEERSSDLLASAALQYLPDSPSQAKADEETTPAYAVYGSSGLWYDALQALNELINNEPNNPLLQSQRKAWLTQVNLPSAAAYEAQRLTNIN